jgi:hypothetical protein
MGNVHALAHRVTALSMACLASAALILVTLAGTHCSFVSIHALPDHQLQTPSGYEFPLDYTVAYIGVHCSDTDFYEPQDRMWSLSRIFLYITLGLGGLTTLLAWLLSTCWAPTWNTWRLLSTVAAATAVLEVPIFLLFESEPCSLHIDRQLCSLGIGSYFLVASIVLWVAVTVWTQCLDPPRWSQELEAWMVDVGGKSGGGGGGAAKDPVVVKTLPGTASDTEIADGESMHMEYPYPHPDPKYQNQRSSPAVPIPFPQDTRQHQRHLSGSSLPLPKNGTILTVNDHVSLARTHSWSSLTRVSELDRRVVAEAMQEQHGAERVLATRDHSTQSSSSSHLSPIQGCGLLSDHPFRSQRKSNANGNGPHGTTTQSKSDDNDKKVLRGAGIVKKSILRSHSAVTQSLASTLTTGPPKDTAEPATSESNYSSNHRQIRRMRKQALMDDDQISALTFHDLEPRLNISMICPDGTVKSIDSCLLGNDDDDDIVALEGMATRYYGQSHKTFLHQEMDALDRVISHFEGHDPEPSLVTSSDSSEKEDDEDSGLLALEDQDPKPTTTGYRSGGINGITPCSSAHCSTAQLSSSYNSGDLGQGCMNPLTDALTSHCGTSPHPDPNAMLQELNQAAKDASSRPAMRLVDDMKYVLS